MTIMSGSEFKIHMGRLYLDARDAACLFGVNRRTIYTWEKDGVTNKSAALLLRAAESLNLTSDDIRKLTGKVPGRE